MLSISMVLHRCKPSLLVVVDTGLDGVKGKIQEVKDFVDERVEALSRKQASLHVL